jgi:UDP-N-acetylglucosamine 2-epimerase
MPGHVAAAYPDHVWAIDFLQDQTHDGRPVRILTITDEHTREAHASEIVSQALRLLNDAAAYSAMAGSTNPYGDGRAAVRIADTLELFAGHRANAVSKEVMVTVP